MWLEQVLLIFVSDIEDDRKWLTDKTRQKEEGEWQRTERLQISSGLG